MIAKSDSSYVLRDLTSRLLRRNSDLKKIKGSQSSSSFKYLNAMTSKLSTGQKYVTVIQYFLCSVKFSKLCSIMHEVLL